MMFLVLIAAAATAFAYKSELVLQDPAVVGEHVVSAPRKVTKLPTSLDYREKGLLTTDLNQHIPVYW